MPGAIRIFHIDKNANCTTELIETNINPPSLTALRDANGNVTATAFGTTCKVDAVSAVINGKALPMEQRTSWLWTLGNKSDAMDGKVSMTVRIANKPSILTADIHTEKETSIRLENTLCLPQKTLFGKPVVANGLVIIGLADENNSREGGVCAVNIATGTIAWHYTTGFSVRNSLVLDGPFVYGVDARNRIFKLNAADGKEIWNNASGAISIDDNCHSAPCLGGGYVYGGCGASLRAIDCETGKTVWTTNCRDVFGSTMDPVYHNGKLFLTVNWGYLQAFDAATGKLLWNTNVTERQTGFLFQPTLTVLPDGMLLRCDGRHGAAVFNPENGELVRAMETPVKMHVASVPLVSGDMAFCGTSAVGCCAFNLQSLKPIWDMKETMGKAILSTIQYRGPQITMEASPVMVDGRLICAGVDGVLYAVNPSDGKVLARFDIGSPLLATPAFIDGRLYVPDYSGRILVFSL